MSFGGGIKFFKESKNLGDDGTTIVASTGAASQNFAIDRNQNSFWRSVGSNDLTTETLTITFPSSIIMDRLLLLDINWKDFNVQYDSDGLLTWTHFANVTGLDATMTNITETVFADNTAYYQFDSVTAFALRIQVLKSQVVDAQKYIAQIISTEELGTLAGYPTVNVVGDRNSRVKKTASGRSRIRKSNETFSVSLDFETYPSSFTSDLNMIFTMQDSEDPFIVWLCGGNRETQHFGYQFRGFRLKDALTMNVTDPLPLSFFRNLYVGPVETNIELSEVA